MRKGIIMAVIGSAAMLQAFSASAIDTSAVENNGLKVNYGFDMNVPGAGVKADYVMEVSPDQVEKMSVGAVVQNGEETMDLTLDDIVIVDKENIYLNLKEGRDTLEGIGGPLEGMDEILEQFGITEDWIALPIPAFDKLGIKFETEPAQAPEVSEEMLTDLMGMMSVFAPTVNDGVTTIKVDNESILAAAGLADEFFAKHKDEIVKLPNPSLNGADALKDLNLVAPFEQYIGAVAAGMAEGTGTPEAECVEQINQLIEMFTAEIVNSFEVSYSANGSEITPEMLESLEITEAVAKALEGQDILIQLSYDDNSAEFVFRVDPAQTIIIDAAIQEDGTIGLEFKENDRLAATGVVTFTGNGFEGTMTNTDGQEFKAVIELKENGVEVVLTTPDGEDLTFSAVVENGIKISLAVPGTAFTFTAAGKVEETSGSGELRLDIESDGETGYITGYVTYEVPSSPLTIEIPVATNGLDVIKKVSSMIFASQTAE